MIVYQLSNITCYHFTLYILYLIYICCTGIVLCHTLVYTCCSDWIIPRADYVHVLLMIFELCIIFGGFYSVEIVGVHIGDALKTFILSPDPCVCQWVSTEARRRSPLELELQVIWTADMDARNWIQILWKSSKASWLIGHLSTPQGAFIKQNFALFSWESKIPSTWGHLTPLEAWLKKQSEGHPLYPTCCPRPGLPCRIS